MRQRKSSTPALASDKKALLLWIGAALISFTLLAELANLDFFRGDLIAYLDDKKKNIAALASLAGIISTAITALPNDIGTPVANNIADYADLLPFPLASLFLQQYLVRISGFITFRILIPIACCFSAYNVFAKQEQYKQIIFKIFSLAGLIFFLVPASVTLSRSIEAATKITAQERIERIKELSEGIVDNAENDGFFDAVGDFFNTVTKAASIATEHLEAIVNNITDSAISFVITSAVVPLLTLFVLLWAIRHIFNLSFQIKAPKFGYGGPFSMAHKKLRDYKKSKED